MGNSAEAQKEIHQGISREEIRQEIDQALFAAQFVAEPMVPIAEPSDAPANDGMPTSASRDLTSELVKTECAGHYGNQIGRGFPRKLLRFLSIQETEPHPQFPRCRCHILRL